MPPSDFSREAGRNSQKPGTGACWYRSPGKPPIDRGRTVKIIRITKDLIAGTYVPVELARVCKPGINQWDIIRSASGFCRLATSVH